MQKRKPFSHLTHLHRDRIQALQDTGISQEQIAKVLKVNPSTISREITKRRRKNGTYDADTAEHKAQVKRGNSKYQGMKIEKHRELRDYIIQELQKRRSPDEIAGRMKKEGRKDRVSKDTIYKWLYSSYGALYCQYLCTKRYRKKLHKEKVKKEMIPCRISITHRPKKKNLIHAEGDTLVSGKKTHSKTACSVVALQKTKLVTGTMLQDLRPSTMKESIHKVVQGVQIDTLTLDNGIENKLHQEWGVPTFFCDPHAPWQKPLVEQSIGLLRRWYIKKGSDLSLLSESEYQSMLLYLNNKYRKSLGYASANEESLRCGIIKSISN